MYKCFWLLTCRWPVGVLLHVCDQYEGGIERGVRLTILEGAIIVVGVNGARRSNNVRGEEQLDGRFVVDNAVLDADESVVVRRQNGPRVHGHIGRLKVVRLRHWIHVGLWLLLRAVHLVVAGRGRKRLVVWLLLALGSR